MNVKNLLMIFLVMLTFSGIGCIDEGGRINVINEFTDESTKYIYMPDGEGNSVKMVMPVNVSYKRYKDGTIEKPAGWNVEEKILPGKTLDDYEYLGVKLPNSGDFVVTTDEFYEKHCRRFFGYIINYDEFYHAQFEVYEYSIFNVAIEDNNSEFRKFLYDEFELKENKDEKPFLFKEKNPVRGFMFRRFIAYTDDFFYGVGDKKLKYDYFVTDYLFCSNERNFKEVYGGWYDPEPFRTENETEFMSKYEVIEYNK